MNITNSFLHFYKKSSNWGKILFFVFLLLVAITLFKPLYLKKEGYENRQTFDYKTNEDLYDDFYVDIYDQLVFNDLKDEYEVGEIINKTSPSSHSIILDVGSGTGHHVAKFKERGYDAMGIDSSQAMVKKAQENFPNAKFQLGSITNSMLFNPNSFTHITCFYFTIYYMKNKNIFFQNCMNWLMPGGYLVIHVVNRESFDPILPPGNPLLLVSPQRYAKERITHTKLIFDNMEYVSNFNLNSETNTATFEEKFKDKDNPNKVRKQEHKLYMEPEAELMVRAQNAGFIIEGKIDLIAIGYEYQYLYILTKPN